MTIDKRINFRGGGMDMGNTTNRATSASMANTPSRSRSTSTGTGGSSGNLGGGGGGQGSDYREYKPPTAPTYTADTIDFKPVTGADFQRSQNEFINNLNINNASRFTPTLFNRTYNPVTLDTVGSRNQLPGLNSGLGALLGFATGIPFNLLASGKRGMKNVNNFMGNLREDFTGYRTQQEYDDARQNRINLKRINTIQNTLDRKYPDGDYSNTDLDERLADLKQSMGILDVTTVNEVEDRPTQTFSFDSTGFNNRNQPTGIEQVYNFSDIDNQVAELTAKQKAFIDSQRAAIEYGAQTPLQVYEKITNPSKNIYDDGYFGYGAQEPTTLEEYNNYLKSIGLNQRAV
tara:strand:- start:392 stop:1429 length:1038 start_codon:yes stop_codon:yes gene_type:complete